jgi:hypothetical protein
MPYTKRPAGGTKVERSTTTTADWAGPWEQIPGVTGDITLPGGQPSEVDITTHDDVLTYGGWRQKGAGLADTQNPSFDLLLDPDDAVHQALLADLSARTARDYRFTFPGWVVKKYGVRGQVGMTKRAPINGYLMATVTILANVVDFDVP